MSTHLQEKTTTRQRQENTPDLTIQLPFMHLYTLSSLKKTCYMFLNTLKGRLLPNLIPHPGSSPSPAEENEGFDVININLLIGVKEAICFSHQM